MCGLESYAQVCNHWAYDLYYGFDDDDYEEEQDYWEYVEELNKILKPCPKCGWEYPLLSGGFKLEGSDKEWFIAECQGDDCCYNTGFCLSPEEAVENWNTREAG